MFLTHLASDGGGLCMHTISKKLPSEPLRANMSEVPELQMDVDRGSSQFDDTDVEREREREKELEEA